MSRKKNIGLVAAGILIGAALSGPTAQAAETYLQAVPSWQKIYLDGQQVRMTAYNINGNNYVKLRDIGKAVGFNVYWQDGVQIDSDAPYTGEAPATAPAPAAPAAAADIEAIHVGSVKGNTLKAGERSRIMIEPTSATCSVSSSNSGVVSLESVLGYWVAVAKAPGTAVITATDGAGRKGTLTLTVGTSNPEDTVDLTDNMEIRQEMIRLINKVRAENGAGSLPTNGALMNAAQDCSMQRFTHHNPEYECKAVIKYNGELPMYYAKGNHPAIIPRDIYYRVKEEMARRASKRKVMQKTGKTEQGKYSAKYALSELLICGECGTPYKRCTWARNGKKRIVWRCVSRLEFGTKYCRSSPTLDEDRLHRAIVAALNEYGAIRAEIKADVLELAELARSGGEGGGVNLPELRRRLEALTAEQTLLLDKILENMDSKELNAQLKTLAEEKQDILEQIAACQQDEEQRIIQASRQREMEEWLDQQPMCFTEYDDTLTRRFVERITVVDAETIQVKIRDTNVDIEQKLC